MAKLYGHEMKVTHGSEITVHRQWYSQDPDVAKHKSELAAKIAPPENTVAEFTPIESDVIVTALGMWRTDKGELLEITMLNEVHACGHLIQANGRRKPKGDRLFTTNGEPLRGESVGRITECVRTYAPIEDRRTSA